MNCFIHWCALKPSSLKTQSQQNIPHKCKILSTLGDEEVIRPRGHVGLWDILYSNSWRSSLLGLPWRHVTEGDQGVADGWTSSGDHAGSRNLTKHHVIQKLPLALAFIWFLSQKVKWDVYRLYHWNLLTFSDIDVTFSELQSESWICTFSFKN